MNKTLLFFLLLININSLSAQSTTTVLKEKSLIKGQTIYLNSKARIGGKNRLVIPVTLPANTVAWYYSFATVTTSNEKQRVQSSGLEMQIARLISDGALSLIGAGLVTNVVAQLIKPSGSGAVDIYLTDANGQKQFEKTNLVGLHSYDVPVFYKEGTAQNSRNGVFQIPIVRKDLSICLRNPSVTEGVAVSLDVVAIISSKEYREIWSAKNLETLYADCLSKFSIKDSASEKICECAKNQIKTAYVPSSYVSLSNIEKDKIIRDNIRTCTRKMGLDGLSEKEVRINEIFKLIEGQKITKDLTGLQVSYSELISLGITTPQVYNGLAFNLLCQQEYQEAKKYITLGLGKDPQDLYLLKNLGNYYLLTGQYDQAMEIYRAHKNEKLPDKRKFKESLTRDIKEFERSGIKNVNFEKVRKELKLK
ncbi:M48 family metallopeptidase [Dyadobacter sp. CY356]|uniref:tetratricopeptide repeat protein n=1 Tax=Dyadobacter sp. CY356 TaxID=2906442 RepID=UPI001F39BDBB|nr:tetratricopeptide repeat protein [Dyadobacter sp. CY356]MCF0055009.1 tetratricopeptide repeat protein [Dyadobacter sp. CY356]